jgi:flavin reductase (DIM6/NTAB) family NADH-FMN oxidoreductase RutF
MMHITKQDILDLDRIRRLNMINSVTGIKPANLLGTISAEGKTNLAIFSSVLHLGSNPALLGFILRPGGEKTRHTYRNIKETGYYTINHVHKSFALNAHYTSAKFEPEVSEFSACRLTEEYLAGFKAPFVRESRLKLGLSFQDEISIALNDTLLVIGEVEHLFLPDDIMDQEGHLDLIKVDDVGIAGLNSYYSLRRLNKFPYARPGELPDFK